MASDSTAAFEQGPGHNPRETTLAVVLAASEWPSYPDFQTLPSVRRSADDIVDYLRGRNGLNLPPHNVKTFIDAIDDAPTILREMHRFIKERRDDLHKKGNPATDLLFYYIGHGGFSRSETFFLSIRATDAVDPLATSITAESLSLWVADRAAGLRTYLVLDCCFAASAAKSFMSAGPLSVATVQLRDALPPSGDSNGLAAGRPPKYGTALLCASGSREPAKAPPDLPYTMFTGGLLGVLRDGNPDAPEWLSLDDMQRLVCARLAAQFADEAVLPQVQVPQQRAGRVDVVPLFHNAAYPRPVPAKDPATNVQLMMDYWAKNRNRILANILNASAEDVRKFEDLNQGFINLLES